MPRAKGERKLEILKALAQMLEAPKWERITTAALAETLGVSEAALYRHFASKAQMYEGLIEFIESSVFTLANRITQDESDGRKQAEQLTEMLLAFAEKNPGMVRVMTGDALVGEHERLQTRMNQRSEERRVGKECRARWWPYHWKKKDGLSWHFEERIVNGRESCSWRE